MKPARTCFRCNHALFGLAKWCGACFGTLRKEKYSEQWTHRWVIDTRRLDAGYAAAETWARVEWVERADAWRRKASGSYSHPGRDHALAALVTNDEFHEAMFMWRGTDGFGHPVPTTLDRERLVLFATDALRMLDYMERDEREAAR